jgi:hypothetical protein
LLEEIKWQYVHQIATGKEGGPSTEEELKSRDETEDADLNGDPTVWSDAAQDFPSTCIPTVWDEGYQPLRDELRWQFSNEETNSGNGLAQVLMTISPSCLNLLYRGTHVVAPSETEIVEHVVGDGVVDVVPIDVQGSKHDADPGLAG